MPKTYPTTVPQLRNRAMAAAFGSPASLAVAFRRIPFVQADRIRAPARAQDLILRQRVRGYMAGDLNRAYRRLWLEEATFMPMASPWRSFGRCSCPGTIRTTDIIAVLRSL